MVNAEKGLLILDPAEELIVEGPFDQAVCTKITVFNPNMTNIAFKLKTTAPRLFYVRPNIGVLGPEKTISIDIFVHPIIQESAAKGIHKFLMQAAEIGSNTADLPDFWKTRPPNAIWDTKIRVKMVEKLETSSPRMKIGGELTSLPDTPPSVKVDPMSSLLQQVNALETERQTLMQKVEVLAAVNEEYKLALKNAPQPSGRRNLFIAIIVCVFSILLGVYCGQMYE